jgi:ABC-type nitrate/sulfonate/bicarbonate transport system permease component
VVASNSGTGRAKWSGAVVVGLLLVAWFVLTPRYIRELWFPSPGATLRAIEALRSALAVNAIATFTRVVAGWGLGCVAGILVGLSMTRSELIERSLTPTLEVLRPLPPVALVPLFILWFGIGDAGQIVLIALSSFMVLVVTTYTAARHVPTIYVQTAVSLGASLGRVYRSVILPACLPSVAAGTRVAAALAFGVGVAAEFMGAQSGLGYMMMVARRTLNTDTILVGLIVLGCESYAFDFLLRASIRRLTRWSDAPVTETLTAVR